MKLVKYIDKEKEKIKIAIFKGWNDLVEIKKMIEILEKIDWELSTWEMHIEKIDQYGIFYRFILLKNY